MRVATEVILGKTPCLVKYQNFIGTLLIDLSPAYFLAMVKLLVVGAALALVACNPSGTTARDRTVILSRGDAEHLMLKADDERRLALESPGTTSISDVFGQSAFQRLQAQSQGLELRGISEEERSSSRELVFWDPVAQEAVLQVIAERRLVTRGQPKPAWSSTARQWWARLENIQGTWKVVEDMDLPPDRWR